MARFKTYSTPFLITADTLETPIKYNLDSIRRQLPVGLFLLNREGANNSIKAAIDRDFNYQKWQITDIALSKMANDLSIMTNDRNYQVHLNLKKDEVISELKSSLRNDKFWKYAFIGATTMLGIRLITKK